MQPKPTRGFYHLLEYYYPKDKNNKCWQNIWKPFYSHCWWKCNWYSHQENKMVVPQKKKKRICHMILFLDIYPRYENTNANRYMQFSALNKIAKIWKQPEYPLMDGWTKIWRRTHIHTHPLRHTISHYVKEGNLHHLWASLDLEGRLILKWISQKKTNTVLFHEKSGKNWGRNKTKKVKGKSIDKVQKRPTARKSILAGGVKNR